MPEQNTQAISKEQRILWLDLLRVTAIFAMVLLHVFTGNFAGGDSAWRSLNPDSLSWQVLNVYDCLVRFCVPVFCMISGVFFLDPKREQPFSKLFSKNIRRLCLAFIVSSLLYAALGPILRAEPLSAGTLLSAAKNIVFGHYHLWFLLMLIGFYLIVPLLRKICDDRKTIEYFLLLTLIFTFLQNALLLIPQLKNLLEIQAGKMSLYLVTGYVGYFVLGSYLVRFPLKAAARRWIYAGGICAFIGTAAAGGFWSFHTGVASDAPYGYLLPNTLLESAAVFLLFQQLGDSKTWSDRAGRIIGALSRYAFGVYLVHDLFNMLLHRFGVTALSFSPILSVPLLAVTVFLCSLLASALLHKIPLLRKYIL